jgi:hypothetical protein
MNHTAEAPAQFNSYDANASFWIQIIRLTPAHALPIVA